MLQALNSTGRKNMAAVSPEWLSQFWLDFERRFLSLLSYQFRSFPCFMALDIINNKAAASVPKPEGKTSVCIHLFHDFPSNLFLLLFF